MKGVFGFKKVVGSAGQANNAFDVGHKTKRYKNRLKIGVVSPKGLKIIGGK